MYSKLTPIRPMALNPIGDRFADPKGWTDECTSGTGPVSVEVTMDYDTMESSVAYFAVYLTASTEYTFYGTGTYSNARIDVYNSAGTKVAYNQGNMTDPDWEWVVSDCVYTPSESGVYVFAVLDGSEMGDMGGTYNMYVTPRPSDYSMLGPTPYEKSNGFLDDGSILRVRSASLAGLIGYPPSVVFALIASKGLEDKSTTPVALTADGTLKISDGAFDFTSGGWRILAASTEKLNLGAGNWTVEIIASGAQKRTRFPFILGSLNGWSGGFGFIYKHDAYNNTVCMRWEAAGDLSIAGSSNLIDDTVYKMRFVRSGNTLYYYQDDVLNNTEAIPSGYENAVVNFNNNSGGLQIGRNNWDGSDSQFYGKIYSIIIRNVAIL